MSQSAPRPMAISMLSSPPAGLNTVPNDICKVQDIVCLQTSQRLKLVQTRQFNYSLHTAVLLVLAWKFESIVSYSRLHARRCWQVNATSFFLFHFFFLIMYGFRI